MNGAVKVLKEARALIAKGWTQGAFARDGNYQPVQVGDDAAECYCISGALHLAADTRITWKQQPETFNQAWRALEHVTDTRISLVQWNDAPERELDEVLAAFDRAIAHVRAKP